MLATGRELEAGDVIGIDADADAAAVTLYLLVPTPGPTGRARLTRIRRALPRASLGPPSLPRPRALCRPRRPVSVTAEAATPRGAAPPAPAMPKGRDGGHGPRLRDRV